MPKETFLKLSKEKKKKITDAFLREFSVKSFDEASLTAVVKSLGIAKGSIYQYFENKLDLFIYLAAESNAVKMKYLAGIQREDFPDFWTYFRKLYEDGVQFDLENPLQSHFLHNIEKSLNSPSIKDLFENWLKQIVDAFIVMVQYEVDNGFFREDLSVEKMAFFLYKSSLNFNDYLKYASIINPEKSIEKGEPVFAGGKHLQMLEELDNHFSLLRKSFDKNPL